jgi:hypothetical protein
MGAVQYVAGRSPQKHRIFRFELSRDNSMESKSGIMEKPKNLLFRMFRYQRTAKRRGTTRYPRSRPSTTRRVTPGRLFIVPVFWRPHGDAAVRLSIQRRRR